jgi:hypothetical protein
VIIYMCKAYILLGGEIMPWGDRTGPLGYGPRTGRGLGYCSGNNVPGYMVGGRGLGLGRGYGRGWGRGYGFRGAGAGWGVRGGYYAPYPYTPSPEEEKRYLEDQKRWLEEELNYVNKRMSETKENKES